MFVLIWVDAYDYMYKCEHAHSAVEMAPPFLCILPIQRTCVPFHSPTSGDSEPPITLVAGNQTPSDFCTHMVHINSHRHTLVHINKHNKPISKKNIHTNVYIYLISVIQRLGSCSACQHTHRGFARAPKDCLTVRVLSEIHLKRFVVIIQHCDVHCD